jgi:hypothetical protein
MPVVDEIKSDIKAAKKIRLPWWALLSVSIGAALLSLLFDQFGRLDLVYPTIVSIGAFGFIIALKGTLTRRVWFWGTITILAALHALLILSVSWTTKWVNAAVLDLFAMLAILSVVASFMDRSRP